MESGRAGFTWEVPADTEITGPMALRLFLEVEQAEDVYLFVGVQKLRARRVVPFEGSYGYAFDRGATGWLKASLRTADHDRSVPWSPHHTYDEILPLKECEISSVDIALLPSATVFRKGEQLRLVAQGGTGSRPEIPSSARSQPPTSEDRREPARSTTGVSMQRG